MPGTNLCYLLVRASSLFVALFQDSKPFDFLWLSSRQFITGNDFFYVGYERREIFQNSIPYDIKVDVKGADGVITLHIEPPPKLIRSV